MPAEHGSKLPGTEGVVGVVHAKYEQWIQLAAVQTMSLSSVLGQTAG